MLKRAESVFESWESKGRWWLPESPETCVRGKLSACDATGYSLEVEGSLEKSGNDQNIVVLGELLDGNLVTLLHCNLQTCYGGKVRVEKYSAEWLLIGKHYESFDSILLQSLSFRVLNLEEWHNAQAFETCEDDECGKVSIKYISPGLKVLFKDDNFIVSLGYAVQYGGCSPAQKESTIRHAAGISIGGKGKFPLNDLESKQAIAFCEIMRNIRALFTLAIAQPLYCFNVKASFTHNSEDPDFFKQLEVHHAEYVTALKRPVLNQNMLFGWSDIASEPQKYFSAWLSSIKDIQFPFWLYSQTLQENIPLKQKFIYLVQALEGYHRCKFGKEPDKAHNKKVSVILDACPEVERKWLSDKLMHSHEPSLRVRVKELCAQYGDAVKVVTGSGSNLKSYIGKIVEIRNSNAHCLHGDDSATVFSSFEGYALVEFMRFVMTLNLLGDAGFKVEEVMKIVERNKDFLLLKQLLKDPE